MTYTQAAVERAMKVHEVLMQALNGRQPWIQVAEVLGVSARTVRRLRWRYERDGFTGLYDHRHHTPSPRAVPVAEVQRLLALYRDRYGVFRLMNQTENDPSDYGFANVTSKCFTGASV